MVVLGLDLGFDLAALGVGLSSTVQSAIRQTSFKMSLFYFPNYGKKRKGREKLKF